MVVGISRPPGTIALDPHPSEGRALAADTTLVNEGSRGALHGALDLLVIRTGQRAA